MCRVSHTPYQLHTAMLLMLYVWCVRTDSCRRCIHFIGLLPSFSRSFYIAVTHTYCCHGLRLLLCNCRYPVDPPPSVLGQEKKGGMHTYLGLGSVGFEFFGFGKSRGEVGPQNDFLSGLHTLYINPPVVIVLLLLW